MVGNLTDPTKWRLSTEGLSPNEPIKYKFLAIEGDFEDEQAVVIETYLITSTDLLAFLTESFPPPRIENNQPFLPARRTLPGNSAFSTRRIRFEPFDPGGLPVDPFGADPNAPTEPHDSYQPVVKVFIEYTTGANEIDPNDPLTFVELSANAAGEFLSATAPSVAWTDSQDISDGDTPDLNKSVNLPLTIQVPLTEWSVRWPRIPFSYFRDVLIDVLRTSMGTVNSQVMPLFFDAPEQTILFVGFSAQQSFSWRIEEDIDVSRPLFNIMELELKFLEKNIADPNVEPIGLPFGTPFPRGHNDFWRPDKGWLRLAVITGEDPNTGFAESRPIYELTDLNDIFAPTN